MDDSMEPHADKDLNIEPTRDPRFYYEDGDIEVVSSDNVLFKLHQHELKTWSPVLKDMIDAGSTSASPRLVLVDDELEAAEVIGALIGFMSRQECIEEEADLDPGKETVIDLLRLGRKYEIASLAHIVKLQPRLVLTDSARIHEASLWHMRIALALQDAFLGALVLNQGMRSSLCPGDHDIAFPFDRDGCLVPKEIYAKDYMRIPPAVMWAIQTVVYIWTRAGYEPNHDTRVDDYNTFREALDSVEAAFRLDG